MYDNGLKFNYYNLEVINCSLPEGSIYIFLRYPHSKNPNKSS